MHAFEQNSATELFDAFILFNQIFKLYAFQIVGDK